jgi:hypothetical protein
MNRYLFRFAIADREEAIVVEATSASDATFIACLKVALRFSPLTPKLIDMDAIVESGRMSDRADA